MGSRKKEPPHKTSSKTAIGIDLGSSKCCVGLVRDGKVEILENERGNKTTPSYVAFTEAERLVGEGALDQVTLNPTNTVFGAKRLLGQTGETPEAIKALTKDLPYDVTQENGGVRIKVAYKGKEEKLSPEQIAAMLLSQMKKLAEKHLDSQVVEAVIAVPAHFTSAQRRALKDAGAIAGLTVLGLISETTAAAVAYQDGKTFAKKQNVLVVDIGGGAFNAAVVEVRDASLEVKAICGTPELSGGKLDQVLEEHLVDRFTKLNKVEVRGNEKAMERLRIAIQKAKHTLSLLPETVVEVDCFVNDMDLKRQITRNHLNEMFLPAVRKHFFMILIQILSDASLTPAEIDEVVLIGGTTRVPAVQEVLVKFFSGKPLNKTVNPDEAVAHGAALQAAILVGDNSVAEVRVTDIVKCPVEYPSRFQGQEWATKSMVVVPQSGKINYISFERCGVENKEIVLEHTVDSFGIYHPMGDQQLIDMMRRSHVDVKKINAYLTVQEIASLSRKLKQFDAEEDEHRHLISIMSKLEAKCFEVNDKFSGSESDSQTIAAVTSKMEALVYANKVLDWLNQGKLWNREEYAKKTLTLKDLVTAAEAVRSTNSQKLAQNPVIVNRNDATVIAIVEAKPVSFGRKTTKLDNFPTNDKESRLGVQLSFPSALEPSQASEGESEACVDRIVPAAYICTVVRDGKVDKKSSPSTRCNGDHDVGSDDCSLQTSKLMEVTRNATTPDFCPTGNVSMDSVTNVDEPNASDNIIPEVNILMEKLACLNLGEETPANFKAFQHQKRSSSTKKTSAAQNKAAQPQQRFPSTKKTSAAQNKAAQPQQRLSTTKETSAAQNKAAQPQQRLSTTKETSEAQNKAAQPQQRLSTTKETSEAHNKAAQPQQRLSQMEEICKGKSESYIQDNYPRQKCLLEDRSIGDNLRTFRARTEYRSVNVTLQCSVDNGATEQNLLPSSGGGSASPATVYEKIAGYEGEGNKEKSQCQQQYQVVTPQLEQHSTVVTPQQEQHSEVITPQQEEHSEVVTPHQDQPFEVVTPQQEQHSEAATILQKQPSEVVTPQQDQHSEVATILQKQDSDVVTPQQEQHSEVATLLQKQDSDVVAPQQEQHSEVATILQEQDSDVVTPQQEQHSEVATILQKQDSDVVTPQHEQQSDKGDAIKGTKRQRQPSSSAVRRRRGLRAVNRPGNHRRWVTSDPGRGGYSNFKGEGSDERRATSNDQHLFV